MIARRAKAEVLVEEAKEEEVGKSKDAKLKQAEKEYVALMKDVETVKRKKKGLLAIGDQAPENTSKKQKTEELGDKEAEPSKKTAHSGKRGGRTVRVMPDRFLKKPTQGTTGDNNKRRSHLAKKPVGYIKDQLDKRGHKIPANLLKGPTRLKKIRFSRCYTILIKKLYN